MKISVFSTKPYDRKTLLASDEKHEIEWFFTEDTLSHHTARITEGMDAVCLFVNDICDKKILDRLFTNGIRLILLRCAGFNNVDIKYASSLGIKIARVPAYSPHAVAEHALALIMTLNRKTHKAYNRVREGNFSLNGLLGFDLYGKIIGVIGTGKIGQIFCSIMLGLGCEVIAYDIKKSKTLEDKGVKYMALDELYRLADVISLQCPLNQHTHHLLNEEAFFKMKDGIMIVNTSRGGLVDTKALIGALKNKKVGSVAIDVYEQEENLFFNDLSDTIIQDDMITRLMSFHNVLITAHQAFFTDTALKNIADTTYQNIMQYKNGEKLTNLVKLD